MSEVPKSREPSRSPAHRGADGVVSPSPSGRVMTQEDVSRVVTRMAHEIVERNAPIEEVHIIGIQRGGVWLADALVDLVRSIQSGLRVQRGSIDVALFRDDISLRPVAAVSTSDIVGDLTGATVVLVDDVLFTGRTVRAALDALTQFGRPGRVQLAVLVDRGHRELPIRPDFVGKNLPTNRSAEVRADASGVQIVGEVAR